jgi:hypothetical protein
MDAPAAAADRLPRSRANPPPSRGMSIAGRSGEIDT